jgi:enoyl-CoA hydratase
MQYDCIKYELDGPLAIITFNRPEVRNALSRALMEQLADALDQAESDENVRVLIITGAGDKAFAAGADIKELQERNTSTELGAVNRHRRGVLQRLDTLFKPTIAAINGFAVGGGCEIAASCTLRIAAETARFGQPEVNLGIIPGIGGTQRLTRLVGHARALELVLTGDLIDAQEAYRIGLVNKVVAAAELMPATKALALKIASKPPVAIRAAKDAILYGEEMSLPLALELENRLFALVCGTQDKAEGVAAFLEKRTPNWLGR